MSESLLCTFVGIDTERDANVDAPLAPLLVFSNDADARIRCKVRSTCRSLLGVSAASVVD